MAGKITINSERHQTQGNLRYPRVLYLYIGNTCVLRKPYPASNSYTGSVRIPALGCMGAFGPVAPILPNRPITTKVYGAPIFISQCQDCFSSIDHASLANYRLHTYHRTVDSSRLKSNEGCVHLWRSRIKRGPSLCCKAEYRFRV